jgi:hypothetical protein
VKHNDALRGAVPGKRSGVVGTKLQIEKPDRGWVIFGG